MLKYFLSLFLYVIVPLWGFNASPSCLTELEVHFFPPEVARQAFDLFGVFQSHWEPIISGLTIEARRAPRLIQEKARKMRPNPLDHPFDPEKTKELVLGIEYEIFQNVLLHNYVYDMQSIRGMFDYIVSKQQGKIDACIGKKKPVNQPVNQGVLKL